MTGGALPRVLLCGLPVARVRAHQAVEAIVSQLAAGRGGWVLTANLDILRRWALRADFRRLTARVTLCVADGMPLVWASRVQGEALPERVTGADLIASLAAAAADHGFSVYLLGGAPGTAERAAAVLRQCSSGLRIVGTACPAPGFERRRPEFDALCEAVIAARPDIVYVALGSPKQELLIARLRDELPATWWLGVGAGFAFLAGETARAPRWMQGAGLEWLHRLVHEPRRLTRRYLIDDLPFGLRLFASALRRRVARSGGRNRVNT